MARKVGTIVPKGDGKWLIRWFAGRDETSGKRKYHAKLIEGTHKQAQNALGAETKSVEEGSFVAPAKQTLGDYLRDWLKNVKSLEVTEATLKAHTTRLTNDVINTLGGLKLDKVTPQRIQALYGALREKGLSPRTIQYTHTVLKDALGKAVAWKLLRENPCEHVSWGVKEHTEMEVWDAKQTQTFLGLSLGSKDYSLWHTLLNTGMRPGESFGLQWPDLAVDRIHVQRAVAETLVEGVYVLEGPKTERGKRSIALTAESLKVLQGHRRRQAEQILASGPAYMRKDFIFADDHGNHLVLDSVRGRWQTAVRQVNRVLLDRGEQPLPVIPLKNTRHTHATLLLKAGVHPKIVSERLGHATVSITLDIYSHVLPDMQDEAVARLESVLSAAL
jgi:integrase